MGNIGTPELFIILIVALLVLGPTRLPHAARSIGKAMSEFRRVTSGFQNEVQSAISQLETEVNSPSPSAADTPPAETPPPYVFEPPKVGPNPHLFGPVPAPESSEVAPATETPDETPDDG